MLETGLIRTRKLSLSPLKTSGWTVKNTFKKSWLVMVCSKVRANVLFETLATLAQALSIGMTMLRWKLKTQRKREDFVLS